MDITIENIAEKLANVFPGGAVYKRRPHKIITTTSLLNMV